MVTPGEACAPGAPEEGGPLRGRCRRRRELAEGLIDVAGVHLVVNVDELLPLELVNHLVVGELAIATLRPRALRLYAEHSGSAFVASPTPGQQA